MTKKPVSISQLAKKITELEQEINNLKAENAALKQNNSLVLEDAEEIFSLREIITLMPGNIFWKDNTGKYLGCNKNHAKFFNLSSPDDIIGKRNCDLMDAKYAEKLDSVDAAIMNSMKGQTIEETGRDINQQDAIFYTEKIPLRSRTGKIAGLLGISIDITERKKMEQELQIAKEKAEASNQAKSLFLAVINHELRTPLTGIIGLVNILKQNKLATDEKKYTLEDLENCSQHLLTLVNDVLDFTKLEAGKINLTLCPVNLTNLINDIVSILAALAKAKGLKLCTSIEDNVPTLCTDPHILRQILINIVSNAIKFTQQGHVEIRVCTIKQTTNKAMIEISVSDTGPGIPADKQQVIFEPFQQLEDAYIRSSSRSGTGLGLAIAKRFADLLQTAIHVKSAVGNGSVFSLRGEFTIQDNIADENAAIFAVTYEQVSVHPSKVLLIEDDKIVQHIHKRMLTELGCEVDVAGSGHAALQMLNQHDIVFVDIGLADITGFDVIKAIRNRNDTKYKLLPVIALTGYTGEEEKQACLDAGANEVAGKPISIYSLKEILIRHTQQR